MSAELTTKDVLKQHHKYILRSNVRFDQRLKILTESISKLCTRLDLLDKKQDTILHILHDNLLI